MKNSMFLDWAYWKPIVLTIWCIGGFITFMCVASATLIAIVFGLVLVGFFVFLLHMMGSAFHESYMTNIKNNYERITDRKWDDK